MEQPLVLQGQAYTGVTVQITRVERPPFLRGQAYTGVTVQIIRVEHHLSWEVRLTLV